MKNKINILIISVIVLAIAVLVVAQSQSDLENELSQLEQDLINADYDWLVNYSDNLPENSCQYIAKIENISLEGWYKTYLTGLIGSSDVFDLKVLGSSVEFDYIVDPIIIQGDTSYDSVNVNITQETGFAHLTTSSGNLVAYWSFDENVSTATTYDYTNNSNDGTLKINDTSNNALGTVSGLYGEAYKFDGVDDYINIDNVLTNNLASTTTGTWSMWVKPVDASITGNLLTFGDTDATRRVIIFIITGQIRVIAKVPEGNRWDFITDNGVLSNNTWTHIALVQDGTEPVLYIDGVLVPQTFTITTDKTIWFNGLTGLDNGRIGDANSAGSGENSFFNGSIDEVMIFNTALNATDVAHIYNNQTSKFHGTGVMTFRHETTKAGNDTISWSVAEVQELQSTNIQARTGYWDLAKDYNITGDSLVAYYNFDNVSSLGENGTFFVDRKNLNNGSCSGSTCPTLSDGIFNNSYLFDGSADFINIDSAQTALASTTVGTWSAWIKPVDLAGGQEDIISFGDTDNNEVLELATSGVSSGHLRVFFRIAGTNKFLLETDSIAFSDNTWTHIALVQDGTEPVLYVDGVAVAQTFSISTDKTVWFNDAGGLDNGRIGDRSFSGSGEAIFFDGSIDEVMIFNRSLTANQVKEIYTRGRATWSYSSWIDYADGVNSTIDATTTKILPEISLVADTTNLFYTPLVFGNLTLTPDDPTNPSIAYDPETPADNSTTASTSLYVNVSVTEPNLENMSYYLYNETLNVSSLVGYWNFDRNTTSVLDLSQKGNAGVRNGGVNWTTDGKLGSSFSFDGSDDYINIDDVLTNSLSTTTTGTWSAWVKPVDATPTVTKMIIGFGDTNVDTFLAMFILSTGTLAIQIREAGVNDLILDTDNSVFTDDVWTHVALVQDGTSPVLYVDSVAVDQAFLIDTDKTSWFNNLAGLDNGRIASFNKNNAGDTNHFNGDIDEVMLFDTSLSASEVSELYNRGLVNHTTYSTITEFINWTGLSDNDYNYFVDTLDDAENYNFTEIRSLTVDTTASSINFTAPTPDNGTIRSDISAPVEINISIIESSLGEVKFNWNGTNETIIYIAEPNITANFTIENLANFTFDNSTDKFRVFDDSLVLMMNMNNVSSLDENDTLVFDISDNGNNGSVKGGAVVNSSGKYGGAFTFDGVDDFINIDSTQTALASTTTGTWSFWFKAVDTTPVATEGMLSFGDSNANTRIQFDILTSGVLRFFVVDVGSIKLDISVTKVNSGITDGTWHHVVAIQDGVDPEVYVDGVKPTQTPAGADITMWFNDIPLLDNGRIGDLSYNNGEKNWFNGEIDEVAIWNRSLSASEVRQIYLSNLQKYGQSNWSFYTNNTSGNYKLTYNLNGSSAERTSRFEKVNATNYLLYQNQSSLTDGTYTYFSSAIDKAGNENQTETRTITLDATFPTIEFVSPTPADGTKTTSTSVYINTTITETSNSSAWIDFNKSLVGYWPMDFSNSTGVYDNSTNDNFGIFKSGLSTSDISTGKRGNSLSFDDVDDYLDTSNEADLNFDSGTQDFSIFVWVKIKVAGQTNFILDKRDGGGDGFLFEIDSADKVILIMDGVVVQATNTVDTSWHHVGVTIDRDGNGQTYIDGSADGTPVSIGGEVMATTIKARIGARSFSTPTNFFNGNMDELMVFNRELNSDEIKALYDVNSNRLFRNFTSLSDGLYNYSVGVIDSAGNLNITSPDRQVTVDTTFPTISYESQTPDDNSSISVSDLYVNVSVTETNFENMSYYLYNETLNVSSLVGYFSFDRNTTSVLDLSQKGNDGAFDNSSTTPTFTTSGKLANDYLFDGVDDFINIDSTQTALASTTTGTWSAWVKPVDATPTGSERIIVFGNTNANELIDLDILTSGKLRIFVRNAVQNKFVLETDTSPFSDNTWTHIGLVQDGTEPVLYIDGVAVAQTFSVSTDKTIWFNDLTGLDNGRIADSNYNNLGEANHFNGDIDEVMIFNTALSSSDVSDLYNRSLVNHTTYSTITEFINWTSLADNDYHYFVDVLDDAENYNFTAFRSLTVDTTFPTLNFINPSTNTSNVTQDFIEANITFTETNLDTFNISLFNSTQDVINSTTGTTSPLYINFSILSDGRYYLNATINDTAGNANQTETRTIFLDNVAPNLTINSPEAITYSTSTTLFNATAIDATTFVDSCWFTIDSGTVNQTLSRDGVTNFYNFTNSSLADATYTAQFYCNDTANNINNTESLSFTIDTSVAAPAPTGGKAGGGTGGRKAEPKPKRDFTLNYEFYDISISLNQVEFDKLRITNEGEITDDYTIEVKTIDNIISFEKDKLRIDPGEIQESEFRISSPKEPGIYTGKIIVRNPVFMQKEVLVTINVKTEKSLFDITLTIPQSLKTLLIGQNLISKINLIQMGLKEKIDVTLNYVIKDFEGVTHLLESETLAVYDKISFEKEFFTGELPAGQYVFGTELIHPGGVAVASTHFVVKGKGLAFGNQEILLASLIAALAIISLVIFLVIKKYKRIGKLLKTRKK